MRDREMIKMASTSFVQVMYIILMTLLLTFAVFTMRKEMKNLTIPQSTTMQWAADTSWVRGGWR